MSSDLTKLHGSFLSCSNSLHSLSSMLLLLRLCRLFCSEEISMEEIFFPGELDKFKIVMKLIIWELKLDLRSYNCSPKQLRKKKGFLMKITTKSM
jgi:hypothetical protein